MNKLALFLLTLLFSFSACVKHIDSPENELTSIKFNADSIFMYVGDVQQLNIQFTPSNFTGAVEWSSSDTTIVSVSSTGIFKAKKIGEARITLTSPKNTFSVSSSLFVIPALPPINPFQLPEKATDIGVGANGAIYITGIDDVSPTGGFSIRKLNVSTWSTVPECAAIRVAVGPDGKPWVVNKINLIFRHDGGLYWTPVTGQATDIAVGADGSVFKIGTDKVSLTGGNSISKWNGTSWTVIPECAGIRIAVDATGTPWVVNKSNLILKFVGNGLPWKQLPGKATDIGIGANGTIYITGVDLISSTGGYSIKKWNGFGWTTLNGITGVNISVSPTGVPYWIDKSNRIFKN